MGKALGQGHYQYHPMWPLLLVMPLTLPYTKMSTCVFVFRAGLG
jgi:hypothetical protein